MASLCNRKVAVQETLKSQLNRASTGLNSQIQPDRNWFVLS